ncbi:MAG: C13 family peptidase [Erythrobacter sp.]
MANTLDGWVVSAAACASMNRGVSFKIGLAGLAAAAALAGAGSLLAQSHAQAQSLPPESVQPPRHTTPWPVLGTGNTRADQARSLSMGPEMERGTSPREMLRERKRLDDALAKLAPQRPGVIDAYVVTVALDSDPVFAREAREAGNVLGRRYNAQNRTLVLAGPDGRSAGLPKGSITALMVALGHIAETMDRNEDVLVLYTTSHGLQQGLAYHYGDTGFGILSPQRFRASLQDLAIKRRVLILSACYAGVFVPYLSTPDTAILTASRADRTSFGCRAENDWTYFGDALINGALRKPQGLEAASTEARSDIAGWERRGGLPNSFPQTAIGSNAAQWLAQLEGSIPKGTTERVGRPAVQP